MAVFWQHVVLAVIGMLPSTAAMIYARLAHKHAKKIAATINGRRVSSRELG